MLWNLSILNLGSITQTQLKSHSLNVEKSSIKYFERFYLSQGMTKKRVSTNDCGPTCVAMIFNIIKDQSHLQPKRIAKKDVIRNIRLLGRLPGWIPKVGGASAPWGLAAAFNKLAEEFGLDWRARRISHATQFQIDKLLEAGGFISFLRFWEKGGAHWTNIVAKYSDDEKMLLLDPNSFLTKTTPAKKVSIVKHASIKADWERQPWWARCMGLKKEIIVYMKKENGFLNG
jgi:hypothetical protein